MSDDVAKSLTAALANEGEHVDDGTFTLDSAAAHRKLREHQLDDPHGYVLQLVEAAWLAADRLASADFRIWFGPTTTVEFSGIAFPVGSLADLFAAALGRTSGRDPEALRRGRVLQLLGLAANSALALEPKWILITASDASGASERVRIEPDGALAVVSSTKLPPRTVRFEFCGALLTFKAKPGAVLRPWWNRALAERELLERSCRYTRLGIHAGHDLISRCSDIVSSVAVMLDGRKIGHVGHGLDRSVPAGAWIVNRGIAIADLPSRQPGLLTVVEVDLPMDLSRKQLLQGPELDAVRQAIHDAQMQVAPPARRQIEANAEAEADPEEQDQWMVGLGFAVIGFVVAAILMLVSEYLR
jgi:hypothetical protein